MTQKEINKMTDGRRVQLLRQLLDSFETVTIFAGDDGEECYLTYTHTKNKIILSTQSHIDSYGDEREGWVGPSYKKPSK